MTRYILPNPRNFLPFSQTLQKLEKKVNGIDAGQSYQTQIEGIFHFRPIQDIRRQNIGKNA